MNSSLQCVSNTKALTLYFNGGLYLYEINRLVKQPFFAQFFSHVEKQQQKLLGGTEVWKNKQENLRVLGQTPWE